MKSKFMKNCLALLLITLVAGFALAAVNEITSNPIEIAENNAKMAAYDAVFENAKFEEIENAAEIIKEYNSKHDESCSVEDVLKAVDENANTIGYVMSCVSSSGYGGDIKVAVGISSESDTLTGMAVLSHNETAGLGARCTEDEFQNQFKGKTADGIEYVKGGASGNAQIDAISGATITTNAVTHAVNTAAAFFNDMLKEG